MIVGVCMKNCVKNVFLVTMIMFLCCCGDVVKTSKTITFAVSADYPPFEYFEYGEIKGFDIDLARLVAKHLGKEAVFENMQFSAIFPALENKLVDAAISTITITKEHQENFDFSEPYYPESLATVFKKDAPITDKDQLLGKKIVCQLGTTMHEWLKKHVPEEAIVTMDNNNLVIESVKAGHADGALVDGMQAALFSQKNGGLAYAIIATSDTGYGIACKKGALLRNQINQALHALQSQGEIKKLHKKWLEDMSWKK